MSAYYVPNSLQNTLHIFFFIYFSHQIYEADIIAPILL